MIADKELIIWLLEHYSAYQIWKETGISQTTLSPYKTKNRAIERLSFGHAIKLTAYAQQLKATHKDHTP